MPSLFRSPLPLITVAPPPRVSVPRTTQPPPRQLVGVVRSSREGAHRLCRPVSRLTGRRRGGRRLAQAHRAGEARGRRSARPAHTHAGGPASKGALRVAKEHRLGGAVGGGAWRCRAPSLERAMLLNNLQTREHEPAAPRGAAGSRTERPPAVGPRSAPCPASAPRPTIEARWMHRHRAFWECSRVLWACCSRTPIASARSPGGAWNVEQQQLVLGSGRADVCGAPCRDAQCADDDDAYSYTAAYRRRRCRPDGLADRTRPSQARFARHPTDGRRRGAATATRPTRPDAARGAARALSVVETRWTRCRMDRSCRRIPTETRASLSARSVATAKQIDRRDSAEAWVPRAHGWGRTTELRLLSR